MKMTIAGLLLCWVSLTVLAQDCHAVLGKTSADVASLRQVEDLWDEAFHRGKTDYLKCLLAPDYSSVSPRGTHDRSWELEHAGANKNSTQPIPQISGMIFEVNGNAGVMRLFKPASADGKQRAQYMADIFAFQDGAWRAVYSQHTPVEK